MNIEPCPFCGSFHIKLFDLDGRTYWPKELQKEQLEGMEAFLRCVECGHQGGWSWPKIPFRNMIARVKEWNRISRIVRAAEEYVMAREAIPGQVFAEFGDDSVSFPAYEELRGAVEGGAE